MIKGFIMVAYENDFDQKVSLALNSNDINILSVLRNDLSSVVRKSVAKNIHTTQELLNELAFDPVLNVAYTAIKNPNCTIQREFKNYSHPCVMCKNDFSNILNCQDCLKLKGYQESLIGA